MFFLLFFFNKGLGYVPVWCFSSDISRWDKPTKEETTMFYGVENNAHIVDIWRQWKYFLKIYVFVFMCDVHKLYIMRKCNPSS